MFLRGEDASYIVNWGMLLGGIEGASGRFS